MVCKWSQILANPSKYTRVRENRLLRGDTSRGGAPKISSYRVVSGVASLRHFELARVCISLAPLSPSPNLATEPLPWKKPIHCSNIQYNAMHFPQLILQLQNHLLKNGNLEVFSVFIGNFDRFHAPISNKVASVMHDA